MQGSLGIGANIIKWNDEQMATAKRLIAAYHQVQRTIVQGDLYRLISPRNGSEFSATQTVNHDKSQSVVFAFIHSTQEGRGFPLLKLKGLDPARNYALTPIEGKARAGIAADRQRRMVDESRPRDERGLQRRLSGRGIPPRPQVTQLDRTSRDCILK